MLLSSVFTERRKAPERSECRLLRSFVLVVLTTAFAFAACGGDDNTGRVNPFDGIWNASGGRSMVFDGDSFAYRVGGDPKYLGSFSASGTTLTFTTTEGTASCGFVLSGTELTLLGHSADSSIDGVYTRADGGNNASGGGNSSGDSVQSTSGGNSNGSVNSGGNSVSSGVGGSSQSTSSGNSSGNSVNSTSGGSSAPAAVPAIEMVQISAGTFTMGSPETEPGRWNGETRHSVTLTKGFYMGIYEVTQEQYEAVMGANPSYFQGESQLPDTGEVQAKRPVECVTWFDAIAFCNALSAKAGLMSVYTLTAAATNDSTGAITGGTVTQDLSKNGYRLPTEAEWEYACRAGTTTAFNCGTPTPDSTTGYDALAAALGWYGYNSGNANMKTHEVGKKAPNAWGVYDMHGNVFEWVWDWYGGNYTGIVTDPTGPSSGTNRVFRDGGWNSDAQYVRSAVRGNRTPSSGYYSGGFRLVRSAT